MAERRKQELEEKRAKLAELQRARAERQQLLAQANKKPVEVRSLLAVPVNDGC